MRSGTQPRSLAYPRILRWLGAVWLLFSVLGQASAEAVLPGPSGHSAPLLSIAPEELSPAMAAWIEALQQRHPGIELRHQTGDSGSASAALAGGLAQLVLMRRAMTPSELDTFAVRHGYRPTPLRVGLDAVRILVNRDNPIHGMTLQELAAVFSQGRQCGADARIVDWGQFSAMNLWRNRPIQLLDSASRPDLRAYFREHALCGGEFRPEISMLPDSHTLLRTLGDSQNALGYTNLTGNPAQVHAVPLSQGTGRPFIDPSPANVLSGAYPLSYLLYAYVDKAPQGAAPPFIKEFLSLILSPQGQATLAQSGLISLPPTVAAEELRKLDW